MDPKSIRFERIEGRKPIVEQADGAALALEGELIRAADERDGTNVFLMAAFDDAMADEPKGSSEHTNKIAFSVPVYFQAPQDPKKR